MIMLRGNLAYDPTLRINKRNSLFFSYLERRVRRPRGYRIRNSRAKKYSQFINKAWLNLCKLVNNGLKQWVVPKIMKTVIGRLAAVPPKAMMPNTTKCITAVMLNIQNKSLLRTVTAAIRFARSCAVFIPKSFFCALRVTKTNYYYCIFLNFIKFLASIRNVLAPKIWSCNIIKLFKIL